MAGQVGGAQPSRAEGSTLTELVHAAGGVVVRAGAGGPEVLLVHRPAYDDWTLPKGKVEPGESDEGCAVREVEEETGLVCGIGQELPSSDYTDARGRPKRVRYWRMTATAGSLAFLHEVDAARWVSFEVAENLLTYPRDVDVLQAARAPMDV